MKKKSSTKIDLGESFDFILIEQMLTDYDDGGSDELHVFAKQMSVHPYSLRDIVACASSNLGVI